MPDVLLIDDEPDILLAFLREIFGDEVRFLVARTGEDGTALARTERPSVILLDVRLPDQSGLELFPKLLEIDRRTPVIFITGTTQTDTAIEAMKLGAFDYLFKPLDFDQLKQIVGEALELRRQMSIPAPPRRSDLNEDRPDTIVGRSVPMREVYKEIGRVAGQDVTVLITGESGTGKELVARAIYQHSRRNNAPFVAMNCAAIPEQLLESELFGHEKGAFTSADRRRIGKFEQANGGTLFLDEVGDMSALTQAKMLRLLQNQSFERLGGSETIRVDVRIIAATNQPLEKLVAQGKFRADLFYRLSVFRILLPALRERRDDIPLLVDHYLRRFTRELVKDVRGVSPAALDMLAAHDWPGNVRELQSVIKQAILRATQTTLLPEFLPPSIGRTIPLTPVRPNTIPDDPLPRFIRERLAEKSVTLYEQSVQFLERVLFPIVMKEARGSQSQAAKILGVTRRTLRGKLREHGFLTTGEITVPTAGSSQTT